MGDSVTMDQSREMKVAKIKEKVERGEYQVDTVAVAAAIVERLRAMAVAQAERLTASDHWNKPGTA